MIPFIFSSLLAYKLVYFHVWLTSLTTWLNALGFIYAQEQHDLPIEIVEKGEEVEGEFAPALFLAVGQDVGVHDGGGVIKARPTHHWPAHIPEGDTQQFFSSIHIFIHSFMKAATKPKLLMCQVVNTVMWNKIIITMRLCKSNCFTTSYTRLYSPM